MFGALIRQIGSYRIPIVTKLILIFPAADPVEAHVHVFDAFGYDGIFCEPRSGRVVCLDDWLLLRANHFDDCLAEGGGLLGDYE